MMAAIIIYGPMSELVDHGSDLARFLGKPRVITWWEPGQQRPDDALLLAEHPVPGAIPLDSALQGLREWQRRTPGELPTPLADKLRSIRQLLARHNAVGRHLDDLAPLIASVERSYAAILAETHETMLMMDTPANGRPI